MLTGPGSPAVFSNVIFAIEQHVEWITDCLAYMDEHDLDRIDADLEAETHWTQHVDEVAKNVLVGKTKSWWTGENIPGKPSGLTMYLGGTHTYQAKLDEVAHNGYEGFTFQTR